MKKSPLWMKYIDGWEKSHLERINTKLDELEEKRAPLLHERNKLRNCANQRMHVQKRERD